jgi:hypothetical protein
MKNKHGLTIPEILVLLKTLAVLGTMFWQESVKAHKREEARTQEHVRETMPCTQTGTGK